ncbi:uncharacterized protein LOC116931903 isoform X2 [Daphnia magna]|uniref:Chitin-binding type-2 domain-containing protein n=2 Tax=Daphnia magna TaxID=35525 RepID=A0ABQ9ZIF0_9CRUS|nr:uncharacterized protein LOC116931903 isoform X2 [Daphnia magna]KAK4012702.1 hypothetical protein OUZ56_024936 [Daphnia magna]
MALSVLFVICAAFLLLPIYETTTTHENRTQISASVEHLSSNSSKGGPAGNTVEGHRVTPMPKHRFSSMLSASKKLIKAGTCSLPEDPSVDLALDHSSTNLPVTKIISIPVTDFSCLDRQPGYYADNDRQASCRIFHYCNGDDSILSFICPTCTLFHEEKQLCDYWYNVDCKR